MLIAASKATLIIAFKKLEPGENEEEKNKRIRLAIGQVEARIKQFIDFEDPSFLMERPEGSGELRVGSSLSLTNDLYSMLFVSVMHYEYVHEKWCDRQDKLGQRRVFKEDEDSSPDDKSRKKGETVSQDSKQTPQIGTRSDSIETTELAGTQNVNGSTTAV